MYQKGERERETEMIHSIETLQATDYKEYTQKTAKKIAMKTSHNIIKLPLTYNLSHIARHYHKLIMSISHMLELIT